MQFGEDAVIQGIIPVADDLALTSTLAKLSEKAKIRCA
jgi:hypothetical protein